MLVELDKRDIIYMLKGTFPSYNIFNKIPEDLGYFVGGHVERWVWTISEENCRYSEEYLYNLYLICKEK